MEEIGDTHYLLLNIAMLMVEGERARLLRQSILRTGGGTNYISQRNDERAEGQVFHCA